MSTAHWKYKLTNTYNENEGKQMYCVSFNLLDPAHSRLFATCGGRRVTVYECLEDGGIVPLQAYREQNTDEEFYAVKWSILKENGTPILLAAGRQGMIRVLDCHEQKLLWTAKGHGGAVNDIAVQPSEPELFLTASQDNSIRLWNFKTQVCVVIINGEGCHTNEVLSLDFHPSNHLRFVSSGMDSAVKIWTLSGNQKDIERSHKFDATDGSSFEAGHTTGPVFSSQRVHRNYVDCVRWFGDTIISKTVDNRILMWSPIMDKDGLEHMFSTRGHGYKGHVKLVQEFHIDNAEIWFIRFSLAPSGALMACGNMGSQIFLFDMLSSSDSGKAKQRLKTCKDDSTIRQTAISRDSSIILACTDKSRIHRFDLQQPLEQP